jgi:hypothetical protein
VVDEQARPDFRAGVDFYSRQTAEYLRNDSADQF